VSDLAIAKIFMNGRSQAVRLPKEFRFDTDEVTVERMGSAIVLRPVRKDHAAWWAEVEAALAAFEGMPEHIEREQTPVRDLPDFD
jgi:antitoxin VapB